MKPKTRKTLLHLHVCMAAFVLPFLLIYIVTGILYTFGIKGDWHPQPPLEYASALTEVNEKTVLEELSAELEKQGYRSPSGKAKVTLNNTGFKIDWSGSRLTLEALASEGQVQVEVASASLHRFFVQLHKAKGGEAFKVMAALAFLLMTLVALSGVATGWQVKSYRYEISFMVLMGVIAFSIAASIS